MSLDMYQRLIKDKAENKRAKETQRELLKMRIQRIQEAKVQGT